MLLVTCLHCDEYRRFAARLQGARRGRICRPKREECDARRDSRCRWRHLGHGAAGPVAEINQQLLEGCAAARSPPRPRGRRAAPRRRAARGLARAGSRGAAAAGRLSVSAAGCGLRAAASAGSGWPLHGHGGAGARRLLPQSARAWRWCAARWCWPGIWRVPTRRSARVCLGMSAADRRTHRRAAACRIWRRSPSAAPAWIAPRWEQQPQVWRQLLARRVRAPPLQLRQAQLRGLQLLAARVGAARRPRSARPRCRRYDAVIP